jgi:Flp pilus assembly protein protease CpaA
VDILKFVRTQWDRTGAVVAVLGGLLVLLLGWLGTSDTKYVAQQIPYVMSGGLLAIMLLTIGAVLWLSADLRDEWRELSEQGEVLLAEQEARDRLIEERVAQEVARQLGAARSGASARSDVAVHS